MSKLKGEMLMEMFKLQLEEDKKVQQEFGITYEDLLEEGKYFHALLDELGELNHEGKPIWCWWKKNTGEVDKARVLEEFADVTHFVLSYCLAINSRIKSGSTLTYCLLYGGTLKNWKWNTMDEPKEPDPYSETIIKLLEFVSADTWGIGDKDLESHIEAILSFWSNLIENECLDFEKDVYEPYLKKNAINQQRVKDGY